MAVTVEDVRKALEDMVYATLIDVFMIKYGEVPLIAGDNSIALSGDPYDTEDDYLIEFHEAFDYDGVDMRMALQVKDVTANGFVVESPRDVYSLKYRTTRRTPKINFWTP